MRSQRIMALFVVTVLATVITFVAPINDSPGFQKTLLGFAFAGAIAFFALAPKQRTPIWASISFLFTLSYAIVNLYLPLLRLINIDVVQNSTVFIWTDKDIYNWSVAVSSLGILYFLLAVALTTPIHQITPSQNKYVYSSKVIPALAISSFFLFLLTSGSYAFGDYSAIGSAGLSSYFYKIFKVSMSALVLIKVAGFFAMADQIKSFRAYIDYLGKPLLFTLLPFLLITFIVGDRGPMIFFAMLTFGPYWAKQRSIGLWGAVLLTYAMMVFLSILGAARQARFGGGSYIERISYEITSSSLLYRQSNFIDQPVLFGHALELAESVRVLNHIIANVPSHYDYGFGIFSIQQIASIIPGLGSLINETIFNGDWRMDGSSNFVSYLIQGTNPQYGDGTSVTGELYLDFGIYGVMFGLFLFGLAVGRHEYKLFEGNGKITFGWVFTMLYFANSLYLARSSLLLELSNVILVFLLLRFATHRRDVSQVNSLSHIRRH